MYLDSVLMCVLVIIGALIAYVADEQLRFTPRLAEWLGRVLED